VDDGVNSQRFRLLFERARDAMCVVEDDVIVECNGVMLDLFRCARGDILGKCPADVSPALQPDGSPSRERMRALFDCALAGPAQRYEWRHERPDGSQFDAEVSLTGIGFNGNRHLLAMIRTVSPCADADHAVRESKRKYRDLAEQLPVMVFEIDRFDGIVFINRHILHTFGDRLFDQDNRLNYVEIIAAEDRAVFEGLLRRVNGGEEAHNVVLRGLTGAGTPFPMQLSLVPVHDDGAIIGVRGIIIDITEQQAREDALRASEERYRAIIENIQDGYYEVDLKGNFVNFNSALAHMLGIARGELMGVNYRAYTSPEIADTINRRFHEVFSTGTPLGTLPWEISRADGTQRFLEMSVSLIYSPSGDPAGFRGIVRDATDRTRLLELIRASEERYRAIIKNIEDGYYELDLRGNVTFFNESFRRIMEYPHEELLGLNYRRYTDEHTQRRLREAFNAVYRTGAPNKNIEYDIVRKNGERRSVEVSVTLIFNAAGESIGFLGIMRDSTERKRAQEALRASEERYRTIIENIADVYYELDLTGTIVFINEPGLAMFNATREELVGSHFKRFSDKNFVRTMYDAAARVLATGVPCSGIDWEITRTDGSTLTGNVSISLIRDANGEPAGFRGILRDTTERRRAEDMIKMLAYHDMLTGLPNRVLLNDRLAMSMNYAVRYHKKLAVLLFDLDGFKEVNDTYGHQTGDLLLQKVSNRLLALIRKSDTLARLGGDEFIVLLNDIARTDDALAFADKIVESFREPFHCSELDIRCNASVGIALYPEHGDDMETLLQKSDEAMYRAKRGGAGKYELFH